MINPADYPWLSHWYEFSNANYNLATKRFANLQARFNTDDLYRPLYDDGAGGDPTFATVSGKEGIVLDNNAFLSCASMMLGEFTFFALVEHTTNTGSQEIGLMGAGDAASVDDNWAVYFKNGVPSNRQAAGNSTATTSFGGLSGVQLLTGVIDAPGRRLGVGTNGEALSYGPQLSRNRYYAQTTSNLWIGDAAWAGIDEKFRGTILAIMGGPVNLEQRHPTEFAALTAALRAEYSTP